jgi:aryl-alcohol dehydrogenase-like predicted oxidoreductase
MINKIALGTVQFGAKYGISNRIGKISTKGAFEILKFAHEEGIRLLDTAHSYGDSEELIGKFISESNMSFDIVSKFPDLEKAEAIESYISETLKRLGQAKLYGYLVHAFGNIIQHKALWSKLESLKEKKIVEKIGVAIYKPEELEYLCDNNLHFDILQIPYNIFDQRFEGYFSDLKKKGVEIQARSIFLQGLFFLGLDEISRNFQPAKEGIEKLHRISADYEIPLHSLCLCFVLHSPLIDKVIIGVDSIGQLEQNIDSIKYVDKVRDIYDLLQSLRFHNEEVILPYNWKL